MATDAELQQMKMKDFMSVLPLTIELAGLPKTELGKFLSDGQIEVRATLLKTAYKHARQLLKDISKPTE
ncbi:hypothetical protein [Zavarzinella formosa]|uniref:hypothetical protein n=1 Tax=Zavarzinella formosa TaxID=360055 RepID=UPI0002E32016|nr:hypothetical protein [Zavarzinella formosa]